MAQTITKTAKDIVKIALGNVPEISIDEALQLVGRGRGRLWESVKSYDSA